MKVFGSKLVRATEDEHFSAYWINWHLIMNFLCGCLALILCIKIHGVNLLSFFAVNCQDSEKKQRCKSKQIQMPIQTQYPSKCCSFSWIWAVFFIKYIDSVNFFHWLTRVISIKCINILYYNCNSYRSLFGKWITGHKPF